MPIGVPRIIYSWGEELPAQWTDIYNFIFRRRMVFLMQYLDDELCNQICGLLINIHMEDRSKELEKKEMESSGLFKSPPGGGLKGGERRSRENSTEANQSKNIFSSQSNQFGSKKERSIEDLMISEEDLAIDENTMLEKHTLQKISLEWLNWNAQFFDYSDEPYLFYLSELLAKDFTKDEGQLFYNFNFSQSEIESNSEKEFQSSSEVNIYESELPRLMTIFKKVTNSGNQLDPTFFDKDHSNSDYKSSPHFFDVYSAFRLLNNFTSYNYSDFQFDIKVQESLKEKFQELRPISLNSPEKEKGSISELLVGDLAQKDFLSKLNKEEIQWSSSKKALAQRQLRRAYSTEKFSRKNIKLNSSSLANQYEAYLNVDPSASSQEEYRDYYRKQTERTLQDEESKKVFMIINSFGGSVGNGITVHDALQFIKAGSMTLALGVAASAASLALAGGTIGERYVTEGCHVMIHQPEGGLTGQASDIWIDSQEIMKIRLDVAEIYSLSTYRPRHKILRDLDRDFYLTATETIYYGLADEIATNEVMHEIIEMTSKVWDYHDSQQQKLLESRESAVSGLDTQTQN